MKRLSFMVVAILLLGSAHAHTALARQAAHGARNQARAVSPINLPADAAAHPTANTEWWYCTGHVVDSSGRAYGIEVVFVKRTAVQHYFPDAPYDALYRTDVAITDESAHQFHSAMTYIWPQLYNTEVSTQELSIAAGPVQMSTLAGTLRYRIQGALTDGAIDLAIAAVRPPLLPAGGLIPWGDGYSYYYSLPQMQAAGSLTLGGRVVPVHGTVWMDHQWGNWDKGTVRPAGFKGWDWMGMRLSDGTDINLAAVNWVQHGVLTGASILNPDNTETPLVFGVSITALGTWRSPLTHILYPSGWRVRIPLARLDVLVYPRVRDQELVYQGPPADYLDDSSYWEGDCLVIGTHAGHAVLGDTYTELMGYGAARTE